MQRPCKLHCQIHIFALGARMQRTRIRLVADAPPKPPIAFARVDVALSDVSGEVHVALRRTHIQPLDFEISMRPVTGERRCRELQQHFRVAPNCDAIDVQRVDHDVDGRLQTERLRIFRRRRLHGLVQADVDAVQLRALHLYDGAQQFCQRHVDHDSLRLYIEARRGIAIVKIRERERTCDRSLDGADRELLTQHVARDVRRPPRAAFSVDHPRNDDASAMTSTAAETNRRPFQRLHASCPSDREPWR